ncbi:MAG: SlyX family protein [Opitutus sp.]|nr:SlyX family protein [Opitutus sp.]
MNESIKRLEEKIAHLEHHVTQQDKAMLELADGLAGVRRELRALRDRLTAGGGSEGEAERVDERPPHY